jgi:hypothetical protein
MAAKDTPMSFFDPLNTPTSLYDKCVIKLALEDAGGK